MGHARLKDKNCRVRQCRKNHTVHVGIIKFTSKMVYSMSCIGETVLLQCRVEGLLCVCHFGVDALPNLTGFRFCQASHGSGKRCGLLWNRVFQLLPRRRVLLLNIS